jgi:hypothetical protein
VHRVPAVLDLGVARPGNQLRVPLRVRDRDEPVVRRRGDQRGGGDPVQAALELRIGQERHPGEPGQRGHLPVRRDDGVGVRCAGGPGRRRRRAVEQHLGELRRRQQEEVRDRVLRQPQPGRAEQHERTDAMRSRHGEFGRDPAAERRPDHVRAVQAEGVQHVEVVVDEVVHRLYLGELVGLAEPGVVGRDDVEPARQPLVELGPGARPAGGVQEQQRLTLAVAEQVNTAAGELEILLGRSVRQRATSGSSRSNSILLDPEDGVKTAVGGRLAPEHGPRGNHHGRFHSWFAPPLQSQISNWVPCPPKAVSSRHLPDCGLYKAPSLCGSQTCAPVPLQ